VPGTSSASSPIGKDAVIVDPTTEAQVAQDVIAAVDMQSKGMYAIAATAGNLSLVESWMNNEGGLWADNPLNTSLGAGHYSHQITTAGQNTGIPIFPDIQIGIAATAATLLGNHAYTDILRVLAQGDADCGTFARAVIDSPWASSHYGYDPSRFCGTSSGGGTVPATSTCLRLPGGGGRFGARATRVPGACGRFGVHGNGGRTPHGAAANRAAGNHGGNHVSAGHGAVHHGTSHHTAVHHGVAGRSVAGRSVSGRSVAGQVSGRGHQVQRPAGAVRRGRR
jgi:hypothetical protein